MAQRAPHLSWTAATTDSDTDFGRIVDLSVSEIEPLVAVPHDLSTIRNAAELGDVRIDEAIFGTWHKADGSTIFASLRRS